ncbi:hypothetical protein AB0T83_04720 [Fluviibacterium sp. DFM31]|uniref:Uncharacterized protein n=1 Tax=Meridianimarinicoccus marinus TaxID=3231483 RepID=A0ABV3L3N2_9RHOB
MQRSDRRQAQRPSEQIAELVQRIGGKVLCTLLDISSGALSELKAKGIAVHLGHDAYDLCATMGGYVRHLRAMAAQWGNEDQAANLTAERAQHASVAALCRWIAEGGCGQGIAQPAPAQRAIPADG